MRVSTNEGLGLIGYQLTREECKGIYDKYDHKDFDKLYHTFRLSIAMSVISNMMKEGLINA